MAGKEAVIVLLDMGASMLEKFGGSGASEKRRIDIAVNCVKLMLQNKMFNTKTHDVGLILFGLKDEGDDKIMYIRGLGKPDIDFLRNVTELKNFEAENVSGGDIFEALDQTIETINDYVKAKKIDKKIYLMTAGSGKTTFKEKQIMELVKNAKNVNVKINVIGFDFLRGYCPESDDLEKELIKLGEEDPNQSRIQNLNQKLLAVLKNELRDQMEIFPAEVAIKIYEQFRTRQVNLRSKLNGELEISPNLRVSIQMFTKTTEQKLPGLKPYSLAVDFDSRQDSGEIVREVNMCIADDPNMSAVDKANVIKAYHYGKQLVPVSEVLNKEMQYISDRELKVLGFVDHKLVARQSFMSGVDILIANQDNIHAKKGLSALVQSMKSLGKYALVRYVWRINGTPKLCVLIPQVGKDHECFYMVQLPTSESVRDFQFNSLRESTPQQQNCMGSLIDKMDLSTLDDGEESLQMKYTFNPTRQYFYQTVFHRVASPSEDKDSSLPPLDPTIREYITPEAKLQADISASLQSIKQSFALQEIEIGNEPSKKIFWQQLFHPQGQQQQQQQAEVRISHADKMENEEIQILISESEIKEELENLAVQKKFTFDDNTRDDVIRKISSVSPVDDFFKMMTNKREDLVADAIAQMQIVIHSLIETSIRGSFHDKALDCIKALRKGCTAEFEELEAPNFNTFLFTLKDKFLKSEQKQFWKLLIQQGVTLITDKESKKSHITTLQAVQFLEAEETIVQDIPQVRKPKNDFDIMDELE